MKIPVLTSEQIRGFHGAYLTNALLWSATTRRLVNTQQGFGEAILGLTAYWICLCYVWRLLRGHPTKGVHPDPNVVANFPLQLEAFQVELTRSQGFRDESLHLSKYTQPGRGVRAEWKRDPPDREGAPDLV